MLPPQLRQAQGLRPSLHSHSKRAAVTPLSCRSASHLGKRFGKHWGPPRRGKSEHDNGREEASPGDARRKRLEEIRGIKARIRADPYKALFGQRLEPFWARFMPDFNKQEMTYQMPLDAKDTKSSPQSNATAEPTVFAHSSTFHMRASQGAGSKPTINVTSSSWDSNSNQLKRSVYDPISGRMMPVDETPAMSASGSTPAPLESNNQTSSAAKSPDNLDALTADKVRASMRKMRNTAKQAASLNKQYAMLEEDYKSKTSFDSEHEELVEARKALATLRSQIQILERSVHSSTLTKPDDDAARPAFYEDGWDDAPTGLQTAYNLEKDACEHGEKESLEHEMCHLGDAAADVDDGYSRDPKGMQTLFEKERDEVEHGLHKSLEDEVRVFGTAEGNPKYDDGYSTEPIGLQTGFEQERSDATKETLEYEMTHLGEHTEHVNPEDYYSKEPIGMQTAYKNEDVSRLEQELNEKLKAKEYDDGYSTEPIGMQTIFRKEEAESQTGHRQTLEQEMLKKHEREVYDDGYSTAPIGLETAFKSEDSQTLENEMLKKHESGVYEEGYSTTPTGMETAFRGEDSKRLEQEMLKKHESGVYEDGYSTAPTGLETAFKSEDSQKLEQEMLKKHESGVYEDGYSTAPTGMETAFKGEDSKRLEQEMLKEHELGVYEDGYSNAPTGMETAFKGEGRQVLEQEMLKKHQREVYDDGYSQAPTGMETAFKSENRQRLEKEMLQKHEREVYDDGYPSTPTGLETAFRKEQRSGQSLEQDMKSSLHETPVDDGYATMPIGLQTMFRLEQNDVQGAKRKSLEDEIQSVRTTKANFHLDAEIQRQKNLMQEHEDGYTRKPMGMQTSFEQDKSLGTDMKAMQGEGDVCTNVGKFANSSMWYKQSASSNLSEEPQKAEQRRLDSALVQEVRDAYEHYYGPINTEHQQPLASAYPDGKSDEGVHKHLNEHNKAYEYSQDNLGAGLAGSAITSSGPQSTTTKITNSTFKNEEDTAFHWAEPALYKVVTYDPSKDTITITTTPSKYAKTESPMAIAKALSKLHQPARFVPHFAALQKDGFHVVEARKTLLVLRKVENPPATTTEAPVVNPIDPTTSRPLQHEDFPIGRFASPTGFVNYDPIFDAPSREPQSASSTSPTETLEDKVEEYSNYPSRIMRREEPVFSGSRRWKKQARDGGIRKERRGRRWRRRVVWVLSVGVGTAACMYVVGVATELAKKEGGRKN